MRNKKAQIQLGESIAVVIIVIFLIIIGLVFWNKMRMGEMQEGAQEQNELSVIDIAKIVQEMPEFRCSFSKSEKANCFDKYKLIAFSQTYSEENSEMFLLYNDYFKHSKIIFKEIYPHKTEIVVYDSNISDQTTKQIDIPINIYDPVTKEYSFGLITVEGYYK